MRMSTFVSVFTIKRSLERERSESTWCLNVEDTEQMNTKHLGV